MVRTSENGIPVLPKELNPATGKMSNSATAFSETQWGLATREYSHSIKLTFAHRQEKFDAICKKAKTLSKQTNSNSEDYNDIVDLTDEATFGERALLVYISCSDGSDAEDDERGFDSS